MFQLQKVTHNKPFFKFENIKAHLSQTKRVEKNLNSDLYDDECDEDMNMQPTENISRQIEMQSFYPSTQFTDTGLTHRNSVNEPLISMQMRNRDKMAEQNHIQMHIQQQQHMKGKTHPSSAPVNTETKSKVGDHTWDCQLKGCDIIFGIIQYCVVKNDKLLGNLIGKQSELIENEEADNSKQDLL